MTQAPRAKTPLPAGALRFGAVLAASGPVILRSTGISLAELSVGVCYKINPDLLHMAATTWWWLVFWAQLLLPVVLAGLLLRLPRRAASLGITAVCAVLALRLAATAFPLDTPSPLPGRALPGESPWPSVVCYCLAVAALLLAARAPAPPVHRGALLWAAAVAVAAWTVGRLTLAQADPSSFGWFAYMPPELMWKQPGAWSCKADVDGVLIVLVALVAAVGTITAELLRRGVALGFAALLVLGAFEGFVAAFILWPAEYFDLAVAAMFIRWHLLAVAALTVAATYRDRDAAPRQVEEPHLR
ncbi:hypothetical protein [Planomonospora parontospora]|uniref:hypothetical protein n=1 Tax=Planomonospora parontospora TaxID=58119 RepID=UPI00166FCE5F|nr:hypothetical protein [Planomonospora parontospora]GGL53195.1 hypothetical protein GCM10014719_63140 [Planomonospora parontospora subsp. antibiotica]GII19519.1 hypothetical protein Ppa05_62450 [Planomonospora parontospora subsp. antibiotica]